MAQKIKASKQPTAILIVFTIIGSLLILGSIALAIYYGVLTQDYQATTATIVEINSYRDRDGDRSYDVFVDFEFNGEQYSNIELNYWSSGMAVGDEITIYCHKNDPTKTTSLFPAIFIPFAL